MYLLNAYRFIPVMLVTVTQVVAELAQEQVDVITGQHGIEDTYYHLPESYATMSTPELIRTNGFPVEIHTVTTSDGYILTNYRIPNPGRMPVFIMHGILCSSRDWLMQHGTNALPFQLHLRGYDIWLGNMRGTNYSQGHISLSTTNGNYWNFGVDEIALFDVPAVIDYVGSVTRHSQLAWIGFSLGTTTFFSAMVGLPTYQRKIKCFAGLAPVTVKGNCKSELVKKLALLALPEQPLKLTLDSVSHGEFPPGTLSNALNHILPGICSPTDSLLNTACQFFPQLVGGFNPKQVDEYMQPIIMGGFPATISVRMLIQQLQSVGANAGKFRRYWFQEALKNLVVYGKLTAPDIDISHFTVPTMLYCGLNDFLAPPEDVAFILKNLPNVTYFMNVTDPSWNHLDFMYGKQARALVYDHVIEQLEACAPP